MLLPDRHDAIFGDASEEIGSRPPNELPPAPHEPRPGAFARLLGGLFPRRSSPSPSPESPPDSAPEGSPAQGGFFAWIRRQLGVRDPETQAARHRELDRLIHLLESDPDKGLRHALSLTNSGPSTTAAPPGTTLPPHPVDFQLGTLSGGPFDAWDVPPNLLEILQLRYRELADRELRLGRFRRAAYIYAHLLGDFASATHALKKGGHFKEAAILYETQLNNPLEAARCFAAGGHVDEAIERFEQLECWLELAELHQRLGHTQAAQAAFRREADQRLRTGNPLGASEILADTLDSPDEALAVLDAAWPRSNQAIRCLAASFERRAHLGRHLDSLKRLSALASPAPSPALVAPLAQNLVPIARTYPDPRVRHQAADLIRVLVGGRLSQPTLPLDEARPLVDSLIRLAPEDRLLARDANRHLLLRFQTRRDDARTFLPSRRRPPEFAPKFLRRIRLPRAASWTHLLADGPWFFAIGCTRAKIFVVRGLWNGTLQEVSWGRGRVRHHDGILVVGWMRDSANALLISRSDGEPFPQEPMPRLDWDDDIPCVAGTPPWLPAHTIAVALGTHSRWCAYRNPAGRTILVCFTDSGDVQQTVDITELAPPTPSNLPNRHLLLAPVEKGVAIAHHDRLDLIHPTGRRDSHQLPSPVIALIETPPFGRAGVIAVHETGAVLRWANRKQGIPFAEGFKASLGVFLRQNQIILVSPDEWRAFRCEGGTVQHLATCRFDHPKATALCTTSQPDEFAVLDSDGVITVYQVTPDSES